MCPFLVIIILVFLAASLADASMSYADIIPLVYLQLYIPSPAYGFKQCAYTETTRNRYDIQATLPISPFAVMLPLTLLQELTPEHMTLLLAMMLPVISAQPDIPPQVTEPSVASMLADW